MRLRDSRGHERVQIEFRPAKAGEIAFACGMNMLRGTVIVD
jgi:plastocyanin domain-containing protein